MFFGILTTVVSFGLYALFLHFGISLILSNTLATFIAILFAYTTNKIWVFKSLNFKNSIILKELFKFLSSRFATYVIDTILLVILVEVLIFNPLWAKVFTSVVVVILNYLLSQRIVFK